MTGMPEGYEKENETEEIVEEIMTKDFTKINVRR